jgi:hypothetical protein
MKIIDKLRKLYSAYKAPPMFGYRSRVAVGANVHIRTWDPEGNLKQDLWGNNVTVDEGLDVLVGHMHDANDGRGQFDNVEVGSDATGPAPGDVGCTVPITDGGLAKALGTYAYVGTGVATITKSFSVTATRSVKETAILNDLGGTEECFAHVLTGTVDVNDGDTLEVEWTITYTST